MSVYRGISWPVFRGLYFVYGRASGRIRKLDRWWLLSFLRPSESRSDRYINVSRPIKRHVAPRQRGRPRAFLPSLLYFPLFPLAFLSHRYRVPRIYALFYNEVVKLSALITLVDKRALSSRQNLRAGFGYGRVQRSYGSSGGFSLSRSPLAPCRSLETR